MRQKARYKVPAFLVIVLWIDHFTYPCLGLHHARLHQLGQMKLITFLSPSPHIMKNAKRLHKVGKANQGNKEHSVIKELLNLLLVYHFRVLIARFLGLFIILFMWFFWWFPGLQVFCFFWCKYLIRLF